MRKEEAKIKFYSGSFAGFLKHIIQPLFFSPLAVHEEDTVCFSFVAYTTTLFYKTYFLSIQIQIIIKYAERALLTRYMDS